MTAASFSARGVKWGSVTWWTRREMQPAESTTRRQTRFEAGGAWSDCLHSIMSSSPVHMAPAQGIVVTEVESQNSPAFSPMTEPPSALLSSA